MGTVGIYIKKNKILKFCFQNFMFSSRFMLFPTLQKKVYIHYILYSFVLILYLKFGVVWGGGVMFFSHFMLFPTFIETNLGIQTNYFSFNVFFVFFCMLQNIKVPLHLQLLVKWEVVSPNSRYSQKKCPFTYWLNGGGGFSKS